MGRTPHAALLSALLLLVPVAAAARRPRLAQRAAAHSLRTIARPGAQDVVTDAGPPPLGTVTTVADTQTPSPGDAKRGKFTDFSFPQTSSDGRCYFDGDWNKGFKGDSGVVIQEKPVGQRGGLDIVVDAEGALQRDDLIAASGDGQCAIATEESDGDVAGVWCRSGGVLRPLVTSTDESPYKVFRYAWGDGAHIIFTAEDAEENGGVYLLAADAATSRSAVPLASFRDTPFVGNRSAVLNTFGEVSALPAGGAARGGGGSPAASAFFASHHADGMGPDGYMNVHVGLFVWRPQQGLTLCLEGEHSPIPASVPCDEPNYFWGFTDPCVGDWGGGVYIAFVAVGTNCGTKGVFVHYPDANLTVAVAVVDGDVADGGGQRKGDTYEDFPMAPACGGPYISFYADAGHGRDTSRSSGLYAATVPPPGGAPAPAATVRAVVRKPADGAPGGWLQPPKAADGHLYVPPGGVGTARACFFGQLTNGTYGVYSADFTVPFAAAA